MEGASRTLNSATDAITINARPNDTINLSHLILDGIKTAPNGIVLNSGGSLTITHCTARNFKTAGISLRPTGTTKFLITDTLVSDNGSSGILVFPLTTGSAQGTLDHVSAHKNSVGISVAGPAAVLAVDSTAANNNLTGFSVEGGVLRLAHSAATGNGVGVSVGPGGKAESAGDNFIAGNIADGTITKIGTQ